MERPSSEDQSPRLTRRRGAPSLAALALLLVLAGCGASWQATIVRPDGSLYAVNRGLLRDLEQAAAGEEEESPLSIERVLQAAGHHAVERLTVTAADGTRIEFDWPGVADNAVWGVDGRLSIQGREIQPSLLEVIPPALLGQAQAGITDLAPTAAAALGLPSPAQATGRSLTDARTDHVLLLFLDGLGYLRYQEAVSDGLVPGLSVLPAPLVGLTAYPPSTNVGTAALLTGAPPDVRRRRPARHPPDRSADSARCCFCSRARGCGRRRQQPVLQPAGSQHRALR